MIYIARPHLMQDTYSKPLREGLENLDVMEKDYLEASRRRLFLMPDQEREAAAEEYRSKAAMYFELYRTATSLKLAH